MAENGKCSKCSGALDTAGSPKWCKACRAEYQRGRVDTLEERSEVRGLHRGIAAMRGALADYFQFFGNAHFSGAEVAAKIRTIEGPRVVE